MRTPSGANSVFVVARRESDHRGCSVGCPIEEIKRIDEIVEGVILDPGRELPYRRW